MNLAFGSGGVTVEFLKDTNEREQVQKRAEHTCTEKRENKREGVTGDKL